MNATNKSQAEKAPNYSAEQEAYLTDNAPITYQDSLDLGKAWGKSPASIRSKVGNMGLDYIPKPKAAKKVSGTKTKAELVALIEKQVDGADFLKGLEKSTSAALVNLLALVRRMEPVADDS